MNVTVGEFGEIILTKVYNTITLKTNSGEKLFVCMRDTGFEAIYEAKDKTKNIELKEGDLKIE